MRVLQVAVIATMLLICMLAVGKQQVPDVTGLIDVLGDDVSVVKKREASRALVTAGKPAIPLLIQGLRDPRVYERRDIANRMNLPVTAKPPKPLIAEITVGERCEELLYEMIKPKDASPFVGNFKVFSTQMLRVDDWEQWWAENERKSLTQIHVELRPLVDEYWKQHGTTQIVKEGRTDLAIPEPAEWDQGFPIPKGALKKDSLGGATSLGPSRNYIVKVYDIASGIDVMTAFYGRHLPEAKRESSGQGGGQKVRFKMSGGYVNLARSAQGTRITIAVGPR